ncbi:MAG: hypothetical protein NC397_05490 [Clostridium sp.]|nr:hypothetical protein [Clostridium sp.]
MNITFYSNVTTPEESCAQIPQLKEHTVRFIKLKDKSKLLAAKDTEVLLVDAMGVVDREIISALPGLKLIMSEGVGYQGIDVEYAKSCGIPVCNNKGVNDTAVAEDTLLLILGCLKSIITGNQCVYDGRQIEVKKASFGRIRELGECTVGLVGFGDIARMTAKFLNAFGARVLYTNRTRYEALEQEYNVEYADLDILLKQADFVSLHLAVTEDTAGIVDEQFLSKMRNDAFLINTARGDLVNNQALLDALLNNEIAGAGLDVIAPEPIMADNILLDERIKDKLVITPHIAGITHLTVKKIYQNIWENISRCMSNEPFKNRVN